jgi:phage tail sheath protein FI
MHVPVQTSYPGVYLQEQSSGSVAISAVPTAITLFVGMANQGRMTLNSGGGYDTVPTLVQTSAAFDAAFGSTSPGELADQVHQFFLNGGGSAYICRIADGAASAQVTLYSLTNQASLTFTALDPGELGNALRIEVDYNTSDPERTFNLTLYRRIFKPDGSSTTTNTESYAGLSMDPASPKFAPSVINNMSALVSASAPAVAGAISSVSLAGLALPSTDPDAITALRAVVNSGGTFGLSIGGRAPITVTVPPIPTAAATTTANWMSLWTDAMTTALNALSLPANATATLTSAAGGINSLSLIQLGYTGASMRILTGTGGTDLTSILMLGTAAGGLEGDTFGDLRPAPTDLVAGIGSSSDSWQAYRTSMATARSKVTSLAVTDGTTVTTYPLVVPGQTTATTALSTVGTADSLLNGRAVLDYMVGAINQTANSPWKASRQGFRLALAPQYGSDNTGAAATAVSTVALDFLKNLKTQGNVAAYTVGTPPPASQTGPYQKNPTSGLNGNSPTVLNYTNAFAVIDREVDLFNLMVLPRTDPTQLDSLRQTLWGLASAFCETRRAMLLVDPPSTWNTIDKAYAGIDALRIGVDTQNAAAYWPRVMIADATPTGHVADPSGSIAGVYARIDAKRGVWKAPAGREASIFGLSGVARKMTDPDNGQINPKALNAIRTFPTGIVSWGARTLVGFDDSGDLDHKYVPVRRTMLMIEESLYRGLAFAVFEPNDEPLWARLRLVGRTFMDGLFRQGAFAGAKASDAYFVACDNTTTTQADIDLGVVNVIVGFAPLKPAEFVVLTVTQMAGQVQL